MTNHQSHLASFDFGFPIAVDDRGAGRTILLLHGGSGPASVAAFGATLAGQARVLTPTHPGFGRSPRPDGFGIEDAARAYLALIEENNLSDVLVIGFSMGGWIAAEMAAQDDRRLAGIILVDAVGIEVPGEEVLDVFAIPRSDLSTYSFHDPQAFQVDPSRLGPGELQLMASNFAALEAYGRIRNMTDPSLAGRLARVDAPALVVWGASDRVVTPAYGRAFAAAFRHGRFALIEACGHLPQLEQPARLLSIVTAFGLQEGGPERD